MRRQLAKRGLDVGIPAAIAALGTVELLGLSPAGMAPAIALEWAACLCLVWRRERPLMAAVLAGSFMWAIPLFGPELDEPATPILVFGLALFSAGRYRADRRGVWVVALFLVLATVDAQGRPTTFDVTDLVFVSVILVPPYVFGRLGRIWADRNRLLSENAALVAAEQEATHQAAVVAERARMAREVHDIIAHSLSVMTLQAAAAEDLLSVDPERAATALREIQTTGRGAMAETSRVLRLLRDTDDEMGLAPQPTVADLDALTEEFRRGGLDVQLTVTGSVTDLPQGVAVSTYRIVREALTNALKYASDRQVTVSVVRQADSVEVLAQNRTTPGCDPSWGGGLGLVGMAERVAGHGGRLAHGADGERFVLSASLPVTGPSS